MSTSPFHNPDSLVRTISEGLVQHGSSLKAFALSEVLDDNWPLHASYTIDERYLIGNLQHLGSLTHLRLSAAFVFGCKPGSADARLKESMLLEILPHRLEVLQLTHCGGYMHYLCAAVRHLLLHRTAAPRLSKIILDTGMSAEDLEEVEPVYRPIVVLAEQAEVDMVIWKEELPYESDVFEERRWGFSEDIERAALDNGFEDDDTNWRFGHEVVLRTPLR